MENNKIDICFICNGHDFVINMSITIISLLKNSDNDHIFHFHIITDYISQDDKKNLYLLMEIKKFYITFYDIPQSIKDKYINYMNSSRIEIPNWWGYSVFLKLEIHNILFNLDKVLLLDTDIIIMKPIHKLLNIDISNYCLITADFEIYIYSYVREHEHHFISVGELPYFGDLSFYEYYSNLIKKLEINDKQP
ncbi:glycosyltransferase [Brachyspira intermedia]